MLRFSRDSPARQETPRTGAAYAFWRKDADLDVPCQGDRCVAASATVRQPGTLSSAGSAVFTRMRCQWLEQTRLESSDKRADQLFGTSVAVDDSAGVVVIGESQVVVVRDSGEDGRPGLQRLKGRSELCLAGSPQAAFRGFYKELQGTHPREANVTRIAFPLPADHEVLFRMGSTLDPQVRAAEEKSYLFNAQVSSWTGHGCSSSVDGVQKYSRGSAGYVLLRLAFIVYDM
jgi:hypothetical protein